MIMSTRVERARDDCEGGKRKRGRPGGRNSGSGALMMSLSAMVHDGMLAEGSRPQN